MTTGDRSACGEKQFGASWKDAEKRLRLRSDHRYELLMYDHLTMIRDQLRAKLSQWFRVFEQLEEANRDRFYSVQTRGAQLT